MVDDYSVVLTRARTITSAATICFAVQKMLTPGLEELLLPALEELLSPAREVLLSPAREELLLQGLGGSLLLSCFRRSRSSGYFLGRSLRFKFAWVIV